MRVDDPRRLHRREEKLKPNWPMKPFSSKWPDGCWSGEPCFLLGGGPSLLGCDLGLIPDGCRVVGCNQSWKLGVEWNFCYDQRVFDRARKDPRWEFFKTDWIFARHLKARDEGLMDKDVWIVKGGGAAKWGDSLSEIGVYRFSNSGAMALWIACHLGCDPVFLVGFDMQSETPDGSNQEQCPHWHDDYPPAWLGNTKVLVRFRKDFDEKIAPHTKGRVFNLNPNSSLEGFEKMTFEEGVRRAKDAIEAKRQREAG